jgi:bacterial/archaeal transporter family protein
MFTLAPWLLFALLSALFAALTAIFAKAGLKNIDSDLATAIRTVIILLITWSVVFFKKTTNELPSLSKSNWVFLILSAIATGLSWLFYYRALQLGKASEVSVIDKSSLLFVVLLSFFFLKEPITPKLLLGVALVFAGMIVVIWK